MDLKKLIEEEAQRQIDALMAMETNLNKETIRVQKELYRLLVDKYLSALKTDANGNVLFNSKNISIANDLGKTWEQFQDQSFRPVIMEFAKDLVSIVDLEAKYFLKIGEEYNIAMEFSKVTDLISKQIGINIADETIISGSYLDRLLEGAEIRNKVSDFMLQNVSAKSSFEGIRKGLDDLVQGSEEVNGAMEKYMRTYAYDTFMQTQRAVDLNIADAYEFNSFVYMGDVIKDSRDFCIERVGGTFTREDLEEWETMEWAGKNSDIPVSISLGGYNCRHTIEWIPDEAVDKEPIE